MVFFVSGKDSSRAICLVAFASIAILATKIISNRYASRKGAADCDDDDENRDGHFSLMPPHLQRLLYKEDRRKKSVRLLAMKKPMYDNIEMYDPSDNMLCTVSTKKAAWYVKKGLAIWKDPKTKKSIRILFEPKAKSSESNIYNQSHKKNICVVCGNSENFMRHYVVPYCYRTLFPERYKTHLSHDIVILCPKCHLHCEQATQLRQKALEKSLRKDPSTAHPHIPDRDLYNVRSAALALLNHRDKLPFQKIEAYESRVLHHFRVDTLTENLLENGATMETNRPNPNYIPGPELVTSILAKDDKTIETFVVGWREHFVESMNPRYLPTGWSIESPVHS